MEQLQIPYFPNTQEFSNYVDPRDFNYQQRHDYYKFLGILPTAGYKQIKSAILAAFKKYHPDSGNSYAKEFHKLMEVKEFLTNPFLKKIYDRTGFSKQELEEAISRLTGECIQCITEGASTFEIAKKAILEYHKGEIEKAKGQVAVHNKNAQMLRKVIEDIQPSEVANILIASLQKEVRIENAKEQAAKDEVELHVSLCWLLSSIVGKTMISVIKVNTTNTNNSSISYTIQF